MFIKSNITKLFITLFAIIVFTPSANAKHLKLYSYDVLEKGQTAITYNLDVINGTTSTTGTPILHEIEIEYGITSNWTQSFYIDYDQLAGKVNEVTSLKTEINYAFSEKGKNFVDFRLNIEYAMSMNNHVDAFNGTDTPDTIEFRPIFEKTFDNFSIVFGPILSKELAAPNNAQLGNWNLGFANAIMIKVNDKVGFNLELHSFMGERSNWGAVKKQSHYLVPNISYSISDELSFAIGAGIGLTKPSDDFTFRFSIAKSFGFKKSMRSH